MEKYIVMKKNVQTTGSRIISNFYSLMLFVLCLTAQQKTQAQDDVLNETTIQADASTLRLSLEQAQDYAVSHNLSQKNSLLEAQKLRAQKWQLVASGLPQLLATGSFVNCGHHTMGLDISQSKLSQGMQGLGQLLETSGLPMMQGISQIVKATMEAPLEIPMHNFFEGQLTAYMGINGSGVVAVAIKALAQRMQLLNAVRDQSALRANVLESYAAILVTQDIIKILESNKASLSKIAQTSSDRNEGTQSELLALKVQEIQDGINSHKRTLEVAYQALGLLLGTSENQKIVLTTTLDEVLNSATVMDILKTDFVLNENLDYELASHNVELAHKEVRKAAWEYGPTVAMKYVYTGKHYYGTGDLNLDPPHLLGVSMGWPLWSSGKRAAGVREKKIALQQAENVLHEQSAQLNAKNTTLRNNVASAYESYSTAKQKVAVVGRAFDEAVQQYSDSKIPVSDVSNVSNTLYTAQTNYVQAVLAMINSEIALKSFLNK